MVVEVKVNQYITVTLISKKDLNTKFLDFLPCNLSKKVGS